VEVVRHQHPREDRPAISPFHIPQELDELPRFLPVSKDRLSAREPILDVVDPALDKHPEVARHRLLLGNLP
jgi:hypothetical protein